MANQNDRFIDEVTDDLRRDRLFIAMRRYGWIVIVAILALVGWAIWREVDGAQSESRAQVFGDAVLAAQESDDPAQAFADIDAGGSAARKALAEMLAAEGELTAGEPQAAMQRLLGAAENVSQDRILHDLLLIKAVMVSGPAMDAAERDRILSGLSEAGAPFELLALEQKALALIEAGRTEDATMLIRQIQKKEGLSQPLRRRLSDMMITLGIDPSEANGAAEPPLPAPTAG